MSSKIEAMEKECLVVIEKAFQLAPPELQSLKKQSIANTYQYLASLCLARVTNAEDIKQAGQKLQVAIGFYPQILLNSITRRYVFKWLLMRLLSPKIAKYFTRPVSRARDIGDPRLQ